MPHIDIKCYPKHLTQSQFSEFIEALTNLVTARLNATDSDVSINYTEIAPEKWKAEVYDKEIRPNYDRLAKKPGYKL